MASLPIEERLLHYFLAMGAETARPLQNAPPGLTLNLGSERIHVAILKNDTLAQRGKILESVMHLSSLRGLVNQLYLAAPRVLGTTIDADVFRSQGIGLLLFDDRRINETVAPSSIQTHQPDPPGQTPESTLVTELETLKSMYLDMEKTIAKLREDLKNFQENMTSASSAPERIPQPLFRPESKFAGQSVELPSFFSNNPWLEVLSKRGREEAGLIAG